jgi:hypothetical protein
MNKLLNASIKRKARHSCDFSSLKDTDKSSIHSFDSIESKDNYLKSYFKSEKSTIDELESNGKEKPVVSCKICNDTSNKNNFVILSCNHVFHIQCLANLHYDLLYKFPIVDKEYFKSCICYMCRKELQMEELMYLHSKFLSCTKEKIDVHNQSIVELEEKMKSLKTELRTCYEYKHKLEKDREEAKKIIASISTNLN